jgi:L-asparaginase II
MTSDGQILVWRGDRIESRHRVAWAVTRADGEVLQSQGDIDRPEFPRSAVKPLQAIPLVESGAADALALSDRELALACASHGGEPRHVDGVAAWLKRLGLGPEHLECGAHPPSHGPSAAALARSGARPSALHNNCSGKHAGMLTLARHLEVEPNGYIDPGHPVQQAVARALADMAGVEGLPPPAVDGCGIPTYPLSLRVLGRAIALFADPEQLGPARSAACRRLSAAMGAHPELVAGQGRPCTELMRILPHVRVKTGAEGIYMAFWPKQRLAITLKVEDGASRASSVALCALLDMLGAIDSTAHRALDEIARPTLRNHAGRMVGRIEPDQGWRANKPA